MDESFELLEGKVRQAADVILRLRKENRDLKDDLGRVRPRLEEADRRLQALEREREPPAAPARRLEDLGKEVKALREEREEVRRRIARLVEILDGLE